MNATPGDWYLETREHVHAVCCKPTRPGEFPEVVMIERRGHPEHGGITGRARTDEELLANAMLVTASKKLLMAAQKAYSLLDSILALKGTGLEVMGYHQNGEPESFDALIEDDMNGDELQMLADAISAATKLPKPESDLLNDA